VVPKTEQRPETHEFAVRVYVTAKNMVRFGTDIIMAQRAFNETHICRLEL